MKNRTTWTYLLISALIGGVVVLLWSNVREQVFPSINNTGQAQIVSTANLPEQQATKAYEQVKNSVVTVENLQSSSSMLSSYFGDSSFNFPSDIFGESFDNSDELVTAEEGSGVIYKVENNKAYVVTNNHVVEGSSALQLILTNGKRIDAKLISTDETNDLAVIEVDDANNLKLAAVEFADSSKVVPGQSVLAIGSPLGSAYATTVTSGVVSAVDRDIQQDKINTKSIQTDAAINQGNSGGPLINLEGQVIGITSMKLSSEGSGYDSTSLEGLGFAIEGNIVKSSVDNMLKGK